MGEMFDFGKGLGSGANPPLIFLLCLKRGFGDLLKTIPRTTPGTAAQPFGRLKATFPASVRHLFLSEFHLPALRLHHNGAPGGELLGEDAL